MPLDSSNKRFKQEKEVQDFLNDDGPEEQSFADSSSESILEDSSSESDRVSEVTRDSSKVSRVTLVKEGNTLASEPEKAGGDVTKTDDTQDGKSKKPSVFGGQRGFKFGFFGTAAGKVDEPAQSAKHETQNVEEVLDKAPNKLEKDMKPKEPKVSPYFGIKEILAIPPLVINECTFWRGNDTGKIELLRKELKENRPKIINYLRNRRKR